MDSSPETKRRGSVAWPLSLVLAAGCAVGGGEGQIEGSYDVEDCGSNDDYRMRPSFFGAQVVNDDILQIRIQRGSGNAGVADGLWVLVRDALEVQDNYLGMDIPIDNADGPVGITLYLNRSCPAGRDTLPVTLPATGGTVRFNAIYAPEGNEADVEIDAELFDATFEDPRNAARRAELSGYFRFLYQRGRPAQFFP